MEISLQLIATETLKNSALRFADPAVISPKERRSNSIAHVVFAPIIQAELRSRRLLYRFAN